MGLNQGFFHPLNGVPFRNRVKFRRKREEWVSHTNEGRAPCQSRAWHYRELGRLWKPAKGWAVLFWTIEGSYDELPPILSPEDVTGGGRSHDVRSTRGSYRIRDRGSWESFKVLAGSVLAKRCFCICLELFVYESLDFPVSTTSYYQSHESHVGMCYLFQDRAPKFAIVSLAQYVRCSWLHKSRVGQTPTC